MNNIFLFQQISQIHVHTIWLLDVDQKGQIGLPGLVTQKKKTIYALNHT